MATGEVTSEEPVDAIESTEISNKNNDESDEATAVSSKLDVDVDGGVNCWIIPM
jgi:hypothetical protein